MIRPATPQDAAAITAIYNDAVRHTTAIFNEHEVDVQNRIDWMQARAAAGFPVLVLEEGGAAVGYASYGPFRPHDGYRATVEHSVYIRSDLRGGGRGKALMAALIERAKAQGLHVMVAGIEASNEASIELHERLGFTRVGVMPQVGQKFGRWLDLLFMQLRLDDRAQP